MSNKDIFELTSSCTSVLKRQNGISTEIGHAEACFNSKLVQALPNQNISQDDYIPRLSYKYYVIGSIKSRSGGFDNPKYTTLQRCSQLATNQQQSVKWLYKRKWPPAKPSP